MAMMAGISHKPVSVTSSYDRLCFFFHLRRGPAGIQVLRIRVCLNPKDALGSSLNPIRPR